MYHLYNIRTGIFCISMYAWQSCKCDVCFAHNHHEGVQHTTLTLVFRQLVVQVCTILHVVVMYTVKLLYMNVRNFFRYLRWSV